MKYSFGKWYLPGDILGIKLKWINKGNWLKSKQGGLAEAHQRFLRSPNRKSSKATEGFSISISDRFCREDRWWAELFRSVLTPAYSERDMILCQAKTWKIWFPALSATWNTIATARSFLFFMLHFPDMLSKGSYSVIFLYKIFPTD